MASGKVIKQLEDKSDEVSLVAEVYERELLLTLGTLPRVSPEHPGIVFLCLRGLFNDGDGQQPLLVKLSLARAELLHFALGKKIERLRMLEDDGDGKR